MVFSYYLYNQHFIQIFQLVKQNELVLRPSGKIASWEKVEIRGSKDVKSNNKYKIKKFVLAYSLIYLIYLQIIDIKTTTLFSFLLLINKHFILQSTVFTSLWAVNLKCSG